MESALVELDPVVDSAIRMVAEGSEHWHEVDTESLTDVESEALRRTSVGGLFRNAWTILAGCRGCEEVLLLRTECDGVLNKEWVDREVLRAAPRSWKNWRGYYRGAVWTRAEGLIRRKLTVEGVKAKAELPSIGDELLRLWLSTHWFRRRQPQPELRARPEYRRDGEDLGRSESGSGGPHIFAAAQATVGDTIVNNQVNVAVDTQPVADAVREAIRSQALDSASESPIERLTVNERMVREISSNRDSLQWSAQQWADRLSCSKGAVGKADAWKSIVAAREQAKRDRRGEAGEI